MDKKGNPTSQELHIEVSPILVGNEISKNSQATKAVEVINKVFGDNTFTVNSHSALLCGNLHTGKIVFSEFIQSWNKIYKGEFAMSQTEARNKKSVDNDYTQYYVLQYGFDYTNPGLLFQIITHVDDFSSTSNVEIKTIQTPFASQLANTAQPIEINKKEPLKQNKKTETG